MIKDVPYFTLQIQTAALSYDVRINDVPLLRNPRGANVNAELPLNPWLTSGSNKISFDLGPVQGEETISEKGICEGALFVRRKGSRRDTREQLNKLSFLGAGLNDGTAVAKSSDGSFDPKLTPFEGGKIRVSRKIDLETPFPRWAWLNGEEIPSEPEIETELFALHRAFWRLLEMREVPELRRLTQLNAREIALAYFEPSIEQGYQRLRFLDYLDDKDVHLDQFWSDGIHLEICGDGRLARLIDKRDLGPICFVENDDSLAYFIGMWYCKLGGQWVQIR